MPLYIYLVKKMPYLYNLMKSKLPLVSYTNTSTLNTSVWKHTNHSTQYSKSMKVWQRYYMCCTWLVKPINSLQWNLWDTLERLVIMLHNMSTYCIIVQYYPVKVDLLLVSLNQKLSEIIIFSFEIKSFWRLCFECF